MGNYNLDKSDRSIILALLTFVIWGFEAPMAIWFGNTVGINNLIIYSFLITFIFTLFYSIFNKTNVFKTFMRLRVKERGLLFLAGIFRGAKDSLYYIILFLYTSYALEIITINYLWPIMLFLLMKIETRKPGHFLLKYKEVFLVLVSLIAPFLCYLSIGDSKTAVSVITLSLISAVFGALHSFTYSVFNSQLSKRTEDDEELSEVNPKLFTLCVRSFIAFFISILFLKYFKFGNITFSTIGISLSAVFSIVQVLIAQQLYSLSMKDGGVKGQSSLTIYSIFLGFFVTSFSFGLKANYLTLMAMVTVVFCVYFVRNLKSYFTAIDKTILFLVAYTLFYFSPLNLVQKIEFSPSTEVLTGIFSIIIGFTLSRLIEKVRKEDELLTRASMELSKVLKFTEYRLSEDVNIEIRHEINDILRQITRFNFSPYEFSAYRSNDLSLAIDSFSDRLLSIPDVRESDEFFTIVEYLNTFESEMELWLAERSLRLPKGERYASWILGIFSILSFTVDMTIDNGVFVDVSHFTKIAIFSFTFTIIYLLTSVSDLDLNRPDSSARSLLFNQRPFKKLNFNYYIPAEQLHRGSIEIFSKSLEFETEDIYSQILIKRHVEDVPRTFKFFKTLTPILMLGIILSAVFI